MKARVQELEERNSTLVEQLSDTRADAAKSIGALEEALEAKVGGATQGVHHYHHSAGLHPAFLCVRLCVGCLL